MLPLTGRVVGCRSVHSEEVGREDSAPKTLNVAMPTPLIRRKAAFDSTETSGTPNQHGRRRLVFVDGRRNRLSTERRPLHEGGLVLRDELLDVHCVRAGELPDQIVRHLEDAVLEVRHGRLAVAFEM